MNYKKYLDLVSGIILLAIAAYHIAIDKPAIYIPALVFGFMFTFQGMNKLRRKEK
ncbi:MAG TPA: hypothetical protein VF572_04335 [Candidatus Saccharimonadales bacterium]|jgi:hypothetical protein